MYQQHGYLKMVVCHVRRANGTGCSRCPRCINSSMNLDHIILTPNDQEIYQLLIVFMVSK